MSQINTVYKKAYLKSIGQDDVSKKRKREEALSDIDKWIKEQEESHGYEREVGIGRSKWASTSSKIRHEVQLAVQRKALRAGVPMCDAQEIKEESERRIEEELGAQEDYATEFADQRFVPRIPLALILSIRRLVK
jgi:hypothetical protein